MTDRGPQLPPLPANSAEPEKILAYESKMAGGPTGDRPWWVYAIACIYLLLLMVIVTFPAWASLASGAREMAVPSAIFAACLIACSLSLIIIPVRAIRQRPIRRRSIWVPVLVSGLLMGGLAFGVGISLAEYHMIHMTDTAFVGIVVGGIGVWIVWLVLFIIIAFCTSPTGVGLQLHRWLIAGSVLELLVAVPTHIIVRQRQECCAGMFTGAAICIGVVVMFIAFGPSVLLLYYRRRGQISHYRDK